MSSRDFAVRSEHISKCYRIGLKETVHDSVTGALIDFFKSPVKNYRKYRSLYTFEDVPPAENGNPGNNGSDIIWALSDVSFEIKKGQAVGIIGGNGAGKSTLLKILSRITEPTKGYAEICGRVSSLLEVGTGFHPELTGRENVYLNGTILGMKKNEVDRKFDEIVEFSGIQKFIDTPVKRFSSGMKVRLAFSVAAHLEPEILIIDEVLAVGDINFQKKCISKMEDVGKEGRTVLFVSHNMPAVTRLCERVILLQQGMLLVDGPAVNVVSSYLIGDAGTSSVREWPDPETAPAGQAARLRAVRVRAENGQIRDSYDIRRPIRLEMEYEVLETGHIMLPHFGLRNERGDSVFITIDQDPEWRRRPRSRGNYVSTAWIPGNLLAEGTLFVNCHLLTMNPEKLQFSARNAVSFLVVDSLDGDSARGDYAGNITGAVRPLLKWTTQVRPDV